MAGAGSRAWDKWWVGNDEQQLLELEEEGSDGSVRHLEDDSDDESEDDTDFLDLAKFPVGELSEEEGGGEQGGAEGNENGSEEGSEDSEEDVPLAQRKVARV